MYWRNVGFLTFFVFFLITLCLSAAPVKSLASRLQLNLTEGHDGAGQREYGESPFKVFPQTCWAIKSRGDKNHRRCVRISFGNPCNMGVCTYRCQGCRRQWGKDVWHPLLHYESAATARASAQKPAAPSGQRGCPVCSTTDCPGQVHTHYSIKYSHRLDLNYMVQVIQIGLRPPSYVGIHSNMNQISAIFAKVQVSDTGPGLIRVQFCLLCLQIAHCFLKFYSSQAAQNERWTPKLSHPTYLTFPEHSNQPVLSSSRYTWLVLHSSLSPKQSKEKNPKTSEI